MSGWDQYITGMIVNKQIPTGWLQNMVQEAAIFTHDGTLLAATPGFNLGEYVFDAKVSDTEVEKVPVNEKLIATTVVLTGNPKVCKAGVRINNTKYTLASYDADHKLAYFSKVGGGACARATKTVIVFAAYSGKLKMSNGVEQSAGICNERIDAVCDLLIKGGC